MTCGEVRGEKPAIFEFCLIQQIFGFPMMAHKVAHHGHVKGLVEPIEQFLSHQTSCA